MKFRQILLALAAASQIATAAPPDTQAVEFFNLNLGHYFITADASEAVGIDGGSAGPGWTRTGRGFGASHQTGWTTLALRCIEDVAKRRETTLP